jgi:hypothetical protein
VSPTGSQETSLGFVSWERGWARRMRGDFAASRASTGWLARARTGRRGRAKSLAPIYGDGTPLLPSSPCSETAGERWVGDQELTYDPFVAEEGSGAAPAGSDGGAGRRRPLRLPVRHA